MEEVQARQPPSSSYPPWVLFEPYTDLDTTGSYSSTTADPNTLVVARTSRGHPIGVSLSLASPPAESCLYIHLPKGSNPRNHENQVIAVHGGSVLIRLGLTRGDYFVYNAGTAASNSLSNMFDERLGLRYVPLPDDPRCSANYSSSRNVCVTAGGDTVKFVNTFARCCCGGDGATECKRSKN
ncbi:hypothetical protein PR202_gb16840 [Eleusine coracana subsp. coracana]|uniref:Uncharacterized protein n=1 Tax=Eleusine coracana subsp. coracana TaxID=191504 RepID=A0AAV5F1D9_ELECO|nr:hypothetical protein PR202_gb16840 [Eleusine coracana subsp. coracana]